MGAENPVGKHLRFFWADWQTYEVVGVVGNTKSYGLVENWQPELFVPEAQIPYTVMNVVIRTTGDPAATAVEVRRVMLELDPYRPPHSIVAMSDLISDSIARERFAMTWLGCVGRDCPGARERRYLQRHLSRNRPTHARSRYSAGARRANKRRAEDGGAKRNDLNADRCRHRIGRRPGADQADRESVVRGDFRVT